MKMTWNKPASVPYYVKVGGSLSEEEELKSLRNGWNQIYDIAKWINYDSIPDEGENLHKVVQSLLASLPVGYKSPPTVSPPRPPRALQLEETVHPWEEK